jgi:hypothetical protein
VYVLGCRLSLILRLCGSDFGITPVDDLTNGISWVVLLPHSTYFIRQFLVFVLFIGYCFGEIMCMWDSYVYQKGILCFLIGECYIRSVKKYCFVRQYAAVPVQLEIVIPQYIGWCVLIIRDFFFNSATSPSF